MAEGHGQDGRTRAAAGALRGAVWRLASAAVEVLTPPLCVACQGRLGSADSLCAACWSRVGFVRSPMCDRLGIPLPYASGTPAISAAALADPPPWDRARAVAGFGPVMQGLVHGLKYGDQHHGRRLMGRWLAQAGADLLGDADLIVPVPLHRWRLLTRRFNQAAMLADEVSRLTGVPARMHLLQRTRRTPPQVGRTRDQRRRNVQGAFRVRAGAGGEVEGRRIVIVDDVMTTGATLGACARALKRAGAERVDVLVLALVTDLVGEPTVAVDNI